MEPRAHPGAFLARGAQGGRPGAFLARGAEGGRPGAFLGAPAKGGLPGGSSQGWLSWRLPGTGLAYKAPPAPRSPPGPGRRVVYMQNLVRIAYPSAPGFANPHGSPLAPALECA